MREVLCPAPKIPDNKCHICKKQICPNHKVYALFEYDTKKEFLNIWFAHPRCAKDAGLVTHRNSDITDSMVRTFWKKRLEKEIAKGNYNFA